MGEIMSKDSVGSPPYLGPMMDKGAVAVDLGATSGRFAAGWLVNGLLQYQIVEQTAHQAREESGRLVWDFDTLVGICRRAVTYAEGAFKEATVGVDTWGVDYGFVDDTGRIVQTPVCYRDLSHAAMFEEMKPYRRELFQLTGIQHQPFNTIYQLAARRKEDPTITQYRWLLLPDLLEMALGGEGGYELSNASTTQLMGTDGQWSARAFEIVGYPVPNTPPVLPGTITGHAAPSVRIARIGSHDTASAVCGLGTLGPDQCYLNVGTWSLLGCMLDTPLTATEGEDAGYSNEVAVDGTIRYLVNIPGFYLINRIHSELGVAQGVPAWLLDADLSFPERVNTMSQDYFNPESMMAAVGAKIGRQPESPAEWAGLALGSLTYTTASQLERLERVVGRSFREIRCAGGGSGSAAFCQVLADITGKPVISGPSEATVLGNLGMQLVASGQLSGLREMGEVILRSLDLITYLPGASHEP